MKLKASRVRQGDRTLYITSLPVSQLLDHRLFVIDQWKPENKNKPEEQGYQRDTSPSHKIQIARFLSGQTNDLSHILPMSLYLNARNEFEVKDLGKNVFELNLEGSFPLYVVDGQHRLQGAEYAIKELDNQQVGDYEMPVIISQVPKVEEVWHFRNINTKGKRVPTDLGQRLIYDLNRSGDRPVAGTRDEWVAKALTLTDEMNEKNKVWDKRIQLPNEKKAKYHVIKQNSFVQSLKPLYSRTRLKRAMADEVLEVVTSFWDAVSRTWPQAFDQPQSSVIQKTPGVFSLHMLLADILIQDPRPTSAKFLRLLADVKKNYPMDDSYWFAENRRSGAGQYGSMAGFAILNERMYNSIKPATWTD